MIKKEIEGIEYIKDDKQILIKKDGVVLKYIELKDVDIHIGKINIPLSNICTMECIYCSEGVYNSESNKCINETNAFVFIDAYIEWIKNYEYINEIVLTFDYGGEPTSQIELLHKVVFYFREKCKKNKIKSIVRMTSNGIWNVRAKKIVEDCIDEVIISLDGPKEIQEKYRISKNGYSFDFILNNALDVKNNNKLKQVSSVITKTTIQRKEAYLDFMVKYFSGGAVKMTPVLMKGNARINKIESINRNEWNEFVKYMKTETNGVIKIIDSYIGKDIDKMYYYGCEHMQMTNWFLWLDGNITCCTDRERKEFVIGEVDDNIINMKYEYMHTLINENYIDNIDQCQNCIAIHYCAGGCPTFRKKQINCDERVKKYAKFLIEKE